MINRPFFMGDEGRGISTPHTLWAKNEFLSTAPGLEGGQTKAGCDRANRLLSWFAAGGAGRIETLNCTKMNSTIGPLFLAASSHGLVALEFDARLPGQQSIRPNPRHLREEKKTFRFENSVRLMRPYVSELEEYFAGKRREFTFPLDLRGTVFQVACWRALLAIPYGETRTYADIARAVGKPSAFRAVGMANNRNP